MLGERGGWLTCGRLSDLLGPKPRRGKAILAPTAQRNRSQSHIFPHLSNGKRTLARSLLRPTSGSCVGVGLTTVLGSGKKSPELDVEVGVGVNVDIFVSI